jgi:hypothetical protein
MKGIFYPSEAARFFRTILDIEHGLEHAILDVKSAIEPSNFGHPRAGCSG